MVDYADIQEVSVADAKTRILGWMSRLKIPVTMWEDGGVGAAAVEIGANIWNEISKIAASLKTFGVGEASSGMALELWSFNTYGHERGKGEYAVHRVTLTCSATTGPYTLNKGDMTVGNGSIAFWLDSVIDGAFPYVLASGTSKSFAFKAGAIGASANPLSLGSINRLITTFIGVTCSNTEASPGSGTSLIQAGADKESDDRLKERNRTKWATRNPFELVNDSFIYYSRAAAVGATRVTVVDTNPRGANTVDVILASATAGAGTEDVALVQADLNRRVLSTVNVLVESATVIECTLQGNIFYSGDFTESAVKIAVSTAISERLGKSPIGGRDLQPLGPANAFLVSDITEAIEGTTIGGRKCVVGHSVTTPFGGPVLAIGAREVVVVDSLSLFDDVQWQSVPT